MRRERFDTIVVGGGSAGCVIAARLSADPDHQVILLEAGPDYGAFGLGGWPAELLDERNMPLTSHSWEFTEASAERARVLGGCSAHNASLVVWPSPGDYARWAADGNDGWEFDAQQSYLERANGMLRATVPSPAELSWFVEPFMRACAAVDYPVLSAMNGPDWRAGVAPCPRNVVDGVRWNTAFAYLDPVRERPNLAIRGNTLVDRVVMDGGRATRVVIGDGLGERQIEGDSVVIAAGAYLSPAILHRSGIGPPPLLEAIGTRVVVPLDGVGANLRDHAGFDVDFELLPSSPRPADRLPEVILRARSSTAADQYWDTQVLVYDWGEHGEGGARLGFAPWVLNADSIGSVRTVSSDPTVLPVIEQPWDRLSDHDAQVLGEAVQLVRDLAASSALAPFIGPEITPGPTPDLPDWIRRHVVGYWHPTGTCRMGRAGDPGAVVDARGRVHGTVGLRVVDASIFPTVPSANTNIATIAAAEFIASTMANEAE